MGLERPTLDLQEYGSGRVKAEFESKMVGQSWHFHANVKAAVVPGGTLELEPEAETFGAASPGGDKKLALGKLGYAFNEESFGHAVSDAKLDAVRLFLEIGMSPNAHGKSDVHPMLLAAMGCGQADGKPRSEILEALTAAHGDVKVKDQNGSTALLWAVQGGCSPASVAALLKAGSDPNVRANGGATPLMFAEIFKRTEIEAMLEEGGREEVAAVSARRASWRQERPELLVLRDDVVVLERESMKTSRFFLRRSGVTALSGTAANGIFHARRSSMRPSDSSRVPPSAV